MKKGWLPFINSVLFIESNLDFPTFTYISNKLSFMLQPVSVHFIRISITQWLWPNQSTSIYTTHYRYYGLVAWLIIYSLSIFNMYCTTGFKLCACSSLRLSYYSCPHGFMLSCIVLVDTHILFRLTDFLLYLYCLALCLSVYFLVVQMPIWPWWNEMSLMFHISNM